jgi:hypothetical protein
VHVSERQRAALRQPALTFPETHARRRSKARAFTLALWHLLATNVTSTR